MAGAFDAVRQQFTEIFGGDGHIHVVRAPGRVNLIGEHTDYNDGFVFPMAIEPHVLIICRARTDGKVRLASTLFPKQIVVFSVEQKIARGEPKWANYSKGIAAELIGAGIPLIGMDALVSNTLPMGGGLSSSAALEVGTGRAMLYLAGTTMEAQRLALLSQKAEHEYALVPCGIMDQTIVAAGKAGHALLLDCRDLSKQYIPIDPNELRVVIVNSMVKHELSGGEYAERRRQCEEGVAYFRKSNPDIRALRDVTMAQVIAAKNDLPDVVFRRCRHVVGENVRTTEAAQQLTARKYERVGELMVQSHNSLRDDYEVSVEELDYLVAQSMTIKGVYGARMTGGGFGGCIVALVQPRSVDGLTSHLNKVYPTKFNKQPGIFVTTATEGAAVVE
ncbi:MAG TPA: galactokinase [Tepidisphaeraceae bacterium]|nr:galactokinase [Tepidisphaeraceae bacterium]